MYLNSVGIGPCHIRHTKDNANGVHKKPHGCSKHIKTHKEPQSSFICLNFSKIKNSFPFSPICLPHPSSSWPVPSPAPWHAAGTAPRRRRGSPSPRSWDPNPSTRSRRRWSTSCESAGKRWVVWAVLFFCMVGEPRQKRDGWFLQDSNLDGRRWFSEVFELEWQEVVLTCHASHQTTICGYPQLDNTAQHQQATMKHCKIKGGRRRRRSSSSSRTSY